MKNMKKSFCLIAFLTLLAVSAFADIAPRPPQPTPTPTPDEKVSEMKISLSDEVTAPTLIVKKDFLRELAGANSSAATTAASTQNIVGGAFLSLAIVFGGVWLMRGKKPMSKPTAAAIAVSVCGLAATIAYANVAPPDRYPRINQNIFSKKMLKEGTAENRIYVRVADNEDSDDFILLIPKTAAKSNKSEDE